MNSLPDFDAMWDYDDPAGTEAAFRGLLATAHASGNTSYRVELITQIARTEGLQRRFDDAHRTLDEVETLLPEAGDRARIRYLLERGRAFNSAGSKEPARGLFLEAFRLAKERGEDFYTVDAAHMMAIAESLEERLSWTVRAASMAEQSADPRARGWLGSLYNNLGWAYHDLGRYEDALHTFEKGLAWQTAAGRQRESRIARWTVARALRSLGRYEDALRMQEANLEAIRTAGDPDGFVQEELGECLLALGRSGEARAHFARAYAMLARDPWLRESEPERLTRLEQLASAG